MERNEQLEEAAIAEQLPEQEVCDPLFWMFRDDFVASLLMSL